MVIIGYYANSFPFKLHSLDDVSYDQRVLRRPDVTVEDAGNPGRAQHLRDALIDLDEFFRLSHPAEIQQSDEPIMKAWFTVIRLEG